MWFLSTLLFCYLAYPWLSRGFERNWWWKLGILAVIGYLSANVFGSAATGDLQHWLIYQGPPLRLHQFAIGMAGALAFEKYGERMARLAKPLWIRDIAIIGLLFVAVSPPAWRFLGIGGRSLSTYLMPASAFIAAVFLLSLTGGGALSKLLSTRPAQFLGSISMAVFISHQYMEFLLWKWGITRLPSMGARRAAALAVLILISYLLHRFVEVPAAKAIRNYRKWSREAKEKEALHCRN